MNLFINSNAQELLKEMKPALKEKLTILLYNFMENLFSKIPFDEWVE
jgi:Haemolymph juvenile hormone binding protein (JHBP)